MPGIGRPLPGGKTCLGIGGCGYVGGTPPTLVGAGTWPGFLPPEVAKAAAAAAAAMF